MGGYRRTYQQKFMQVKKDKNNAKAFETKLLLIFYLFTYNSKSTIFL